MQFTPESLARVIKNVDRETLIKALDLAQLDATIDTDSIVTITELQGLFNTITNHAIFAKPMSAWSRVALENLRDRKAPEEAGNAYSQLVIEGMIAYAILKDFEDSGVLDKLWQIAGIMEGFL